MARTWPSGLLSEERLALYPAALLAALASGAVVGGLVEAHPGGDYPCFYAAGVLVRGGADLYDARAQAAAQAQYLADAGWLPFAYPPVVALAHAGLAWLPYRVAWLVHTALMACATAATPIAARPLLPRSTRRLPLAIAALCTYPAYRAVIGGQWTALLALLAVGSARALQAERPGAAGLLAGLALVKPTVGVPLAGLVALASRGRALGGIAAAAAGLWALSAAVAGPAWLSRWWTVAWAFQAEAQGIEVAGNVGLLGVAEHLLGAGPPARAVGAIAVAGLSAGLAGLWWRPRGWAVRLGVAAAWIPLLGPHALWYDAGLAGIAVLALADRGRPAAAGVAWLAVGLGALARGSALEPLPVALGGIGAWLALTPPAPAPAADRAPGGSCPPPPE